MMGKWIYLVSALFVLSSTAAEETSSLNSNNDHGVWLVEELKDTLSGDLSAVLHLEQRFGADYRLFWYHQCELLFFYSLTDAINKGCKDSFLKSFSLAAGCAQIERFQKNTRGIYQWVGTTRPEIQADLGMEWEKWVLTQRLRGEYSQYNSSHYKSHGTFRYRVQLNAPWKWTCLKITPFISSEFFFRAYTWSKSNPHGLVGGFHEDRLRFGFTSKIKDHIIFDAWWQWRLTKQTPETSPGWFNNYAWGTRLLLSF